MFERFRNWVRSRAGDDEEPVARPPALDRTGAMVRPRPAQRPAEPAPKPATRTLPRVKPSVDGEIEDLGPGKNVLIRNKYRRQDTGTHETLTIVDDSIVETGEEPGIDPYNTGRFDRSKNWDKRFR